MPALVIKSFPETLHARLRQIAARHRRSVTQETIHLIELAISSEEKATPVSNSGQSLSLAVLGLRRSLARQLSPLHEDRCGFGEGDAAAAVVELEDASQSPETPPGHRVFRAPSLRFEITSSRRFA